MQRVLAPGVALVLAAVSVVACNPPKKPPPPPPPEVQIATDPALFPAFSTAISDYVSRCSASSAVQVTVSASEGTTVSVDGQAPQSGDFTAEVTRDVGQSFPIVVQPPAAPSSTHYVRCLPMEFPAFTVERPGSPQAEWYVAAPIFTLGIGYPVIFDNNGVPLWWHLPPVGATYFATLLPNGNVAWTLGDIGAEEHALDGSLVGTVDTVGGTADRHDFLLLPNGNYVLVANRPRCCFDLRGLGGPASAEVLDHVVQELSPSGEVVWEWATSDHIGISETTAQWHETVVGSGSPYDVYHYNSVEPTETGYVLSFRHLNAVYHLDRATGAIDWKLGGTQRTETLTIVDDPVFDAGGDFGGQHDARVRDDGTLTLFDNGSGASRPPRVVRYQLDVTQATATLLEELYETLAPTSICCGGTRKLPGGNWVTAWGGAIPVGTEMSPSGDPVFVLKFDDPSTFMYRMIPVPPGELSREDLRAGMDAQYPSPP